MHINRSRCPINHSVELLGDKWSLLVLRDIAMLENRTFRALLRGSQEGISPAVLSTKLRGLVDLGFIDRAEVSRGKQGRFTLTDKGVDVVPLLFELARLGSVMNPTTEVTAPGVEQLYGNSAGIEAFTHAVRERERELRRLPVNVGRDVREL